MIEMFMVQNPYYTDCFPLNFVSEEVAGYLKCYRRGYGRAIRGIWCGHPEKGGNGWKVETSLSNAIPIHSRLVCKFREFKTLAVISTTKLQLPRKKLHFAYVCQKS